MGRPHRRPLGGGAAARRLPFSRGIQRLGLHRFWGCGCTTAFTRRNTRIIRPRAGEVLGWIRDGKLRLRTEFEFPLKDAAESHRALEGRKTTGKVLLVP